MRGLPGLIEALLFVFCPSKDLLKTNRCICCPIETGGRGEGEKFRNEYFCPILSQTKENDNNIVYFFCYQFFIPKHGFSNKIQFSFIGEIGIQI